MSEAPVLVLIFPHAAAGGARLSSCFRQGNWGQALEAWQGSDPAVQIKTWTEDEMSTVPSTITKQQD